MKKNVENEKLDINSAKTVNGDEDSGSFATSGLDDERIIVVGRTKPEDGSLLVNRW